MSPSDHQESFRVDSGDTIQGDILWEAKMRYFETLNYSYKEDQQRAIRENIKCEHPGCNLIADSRCIECLMNRSGDHWFCQTFRLLHISGYQFPRNIRLTYNNEHSFAHGHQYHPKKSFWKWSVKET